MTVLHLSRCVVSLLFFIRCVVGKYQVIQLTEFCRNGARTTSYKGSGSRFEETDSLEPNTLTPNGFRMQYLLGAYLNSSYPEIFSPSESKLIAPSDIEVFTSPRTVSQLSASSQMQGILVLGTGPKTTLPDDSPYVKVPYQDLSVTVSGDDALPFGMNLIGFDQQPVFYDMLFMSDLQRTCPQASRFLESNRWSRYQTYAYLLEDAKNTLNELGYTAALYTDQQEWNLEGIFQLTDQLISLQSYTGKLPENISESLFKELRLLSSLKTSLDLNDPDHIRLFTDSVARNILYSLRQKISYPNMTSSFRLFVGNQRGTFAHMLLFNLTSVGCQISALKGKPVSNCATSPDFASHFLYELLVDTKQDTDPNPSPKEYYVRVLFNGKVVKFCNSKEYCPFKEFSKLYEQIFFMDAEKKLELCGNPYDINKANTEMRQIIKPASVLIVIVGGSVILMMCTYLLFRQYSNADTDETRITKDEPNPSLNLTQTIEHSFLPIS